MGWLVGCLLAQALAATPTPESGAAWLSHIDAAAAVQDAHMTLELTVTDPRGESASRTIEIWQRGDSQRLVRMTAPSRLRGVGLLVTHGETLHLFLPQFPPARRVVGSSRADAFLGTDFAVDDLARIRYTGAYTAAVAGTEGALTRLTLTPLQKTGDAQILAWVGADGVVRRLDHLDGKGQVTRRLTMSDVREEGGVPLAHRLEVQDLVRGRSTVAVLQSAAINQGLPETLFTVANLESP